MTYDSGAPVPPPGSMVRLPGDDRFVEVGPSMPSANGVTLFVAELVDRFEVVEGYQALRGRFAGVVGDGGRERLGCLGFERVRRRRLVYRRQPLRVQRRRERVFRLDNPVGQLVTHLAVPDCLRGVLTVVTAQPGTASQQE